MKLMLAGRRSPMRATAPSVQERYALRRGYHESAASIALIATLAACVLLVLCALPVRV